MVSDEETLGDGDFATATETLDDDDDAPNCLPVVAAADFGTGKIVPLPPDLNDSAKKRVFYPQC